MDKKTFCLILVVGRSSLQARKEKPGDGGHVEPSERNYAFAPRSAGTFVRKNDIADDS